MKQNIEIDGKQVPFKATAAISRIYRMKFYRDIYKDLRFLEKSVRDGSEENSNLDMFSLEMFENIAYIMRNTQTRLSRIPRRTGWTASTHFPFIRYFHS